MIQFPGRPDFLRQGYQFYFNEYEQTDIAVLESIDADNQESQYLIAIKLAKTDSQKANALGKYANFFADQKQDYNEAEIMYRRAIEADPDHANILGNFALFLKNQKQDYNEAEIMYRRAIEADPDDANTLGNFAYFLHQQKQDYNEAEIMYRRAIEADPNHANNLGNFAYFLAGQKQDYNEAEIMYHRAIEADPNHANSLGNFAKFLFIIGKYEQANSMLEQAEIQIDLAPDLLIELAFYRYAHCLPYVLLPVKQLLQNHARSTGWNLADNVERAIQDGHPQFELLADIAKVISDGDAIEALEQYPEWQDT